MNAEKIKEGLEILYAGRHLDNSYYDFLREESPNFNKFFLKIQKELRKAIKRGYIEENN